MQNQYLSPKLDVVFKMIFGYEHNKDILANMLSSFIGIAENDMQEITILNPFSELEHAGEKQSILDLKVELNTGERVDVEIQLQNQQDLIPRFHKYKSEMFTEQLKSGSDYTGLAPVIFVAIVDFCLYKNDKDCLHDFVFYNQKHGIVFSDYEIIYILEIPKSKCNAGNPVLVNWLKFLNAETKEEFNMLATTSEPMRKAVKEVFRLSADEEARMFAKARERAIMDYNSGMSCARREGLAEGMEKVFALLKQGYSVDEAEKLLRGGV
jgi:predicted transposase/invertase (TIGR01784 family)